MSTDKIVDRAVELLVYAPVGLVASARQLLPEVIERGRREVNGQVGVARFVGEFAVRQGQAQAGRAVERARQQAADVLDTLADRAEEAAGRDAGTAPRPAPPPAGAATAAPATASSPSPAATAAPGEQETAPAAAAPGDATADGLAIPGYDALSASQVVPRLNGLSPTELEQVRAYELATRGRKTILSKISQLQVP